METSKKWENIRNICIIKMLAKLGHYPIKTTEKAAWFLSPLRSETTASFNVSLHKNLWYDFGLGKGGSAIDLMMNIKSCNAKEAFEFLKEDLISFTFSPPSNFQPKNDIIQIITIDLIKNPSLLNYLKSRKIPLNIARNYCYQVWYEIREKNYFAIGLQNNKGGWELRNKYFKGSSRPKSYSIIKRAAKQLIIMEGMFDFLSLAFINKDLVQKSDIIILNSLGFIHKIKSLIPHYNMVLIYLDNDPAGKKATSSLLNLYNNITDCSDLYRDYPDLNEKLKKENY
ncbi:CHC2-type zinc finger protein [Salegentibacter sp. 24]|jgi:DNA primase|uniref:toprim domain-containing protein n=1 Tax=Salegentibacter sp. 24 TaxID=2183986 RepID=UPI0010604CE1|nr:toprim domain-containing protein [Salegentibacter sp. 24]TDN89441.1 CHC2-type zinc finger protein [Salegentibacter sp. 24]